MDNQSDDEPEGDTCGHFYMESEVGIRLQCLHGVLDHGDWNLALARETLKVLSAAEELADFVLMGKKPDSNVRRLSEYAN